MINPETKILYSKYLYFLNVLYDDRHDFYTDFIQSEEFFDDREHILRCFKVMKLLLTRFRVKQRKMITRFNKEKSFIKTRVYRSLLSPVFCPDIVGEIISFINI